MPMRTLSRIKTKPKVMLKKDGSLSKQGKEWEMLTTREACLDLTMQVVLR